MTATTFLPRRWKRPPLIKPDKLTPDVLTKIYGEEDWSATIRKVDESAPEDVDSIVADAMPPASVDRDRMAGLR